MSKKRSVIYYVLMLRFCCMIYSSHGTDDCNAADGVGSWMGDGTCDPQNLMSECDWDGGDCCISTCVDDKYACGTDGYVCLDPALPGNETCEEGSLPACPVYNQTFVVENATHAATLAERVNCSSGVFYVEWMDNIVVDTEIVVSCGTILNITGVGSNAILDGGGKTRLFRVVNAFLQLDDVQIRDGIATFGGAIAAIDSTLALNRTSFINNTATDKNGGAVFLYRSSISFSGQTDFFNNCAYYGGALYAARNSSASWGNASTFTGNSASHSGGALGVVVGSTVSWTAETTFEKNAATTYRGGALFLEGGSSALYANFTDNNALYEGGAIFIDIGSNASWRGDAYFSHNSATYAGGGAMMIADSSTVQLSGTTLFEYNECFSEGGAISSRTLDLIASTSAISQESLLTITGMAKFAYNTCKSNGGAIALLGGLSTSFESSNISFIGNVAGVAGGGVFLSTARGGSTFTNVNFSSNHAEAGGGAYISGSGLTVDLSDDEMWAIFDDCSFTENIAETTGGAIEIATGSAIIRNTLFNGNIAKTGGALRLAGATCIDGCTFEANLAEAGGGLAISLISYEFKIMNCSFGDNTYDCNYGTYIEETNSQSGERFDAICSGCHNFCEDCTIKNEWKVPISCSAVLDHSSSLEGSITTLETLQIHHGYWRATNDSTNILKCYNEDACLGGITGSSDFCNEGYTGPYCAVCTDGYLSEPGFTCVKCSENIWGIVAAAIIVVIAVVLAFIAYTFLTSGEIMGTLRDTIARLLHRVPLYSIKIIIVTWQIVTQVSTATGITYSVIYQRFLNAVSVFDFDLSWLLSAACVMGMDLHGRLLIVTIGPIMIMLSLGATYTYVVQRHQASKETHRNLRDKHISMVLFVMSLVYSTSSSVVFQMFDCETLDDGKTYLHADYTIECDKPKHRAFMIYTGFMIFLYPFGIPAFFSYLLFRNRRELIKVTTGKESLSVQPIAGLWKPYKPSRFYYEVIECVRRIAITGVIVTIKKESAAQIAITLVLSFVFAVLSECLAPYKSQWDAWVSRLGHAVVFCTVYYASLLKVDVSDESSKSQDTFEVVLVVTHTVMIVLVIFEAILAGCLFQREEQAEDPLPRPNRHYTGNFRAASYSVPQTWLDTLEVLDTNGIETEVRNTSRTSRYGNPNRLGARCRPAIVPLHTEPASGQTDPV